jgi:MarR family transcriptional regulator, organic hydroperoxide resistance regulator
VRRQPSSGDRRIKVLELTQAGARLRSSVMERMTQPPEILGRLSVEEQRELVRILKRLLA